MGLKIKWNDDRVRGAMTAILLIGRARLARGEPTDWVAESLEDYRADADFYKANKATWAPVAEMGPLTKPSRVACYQARLAAVDRLSAKLVQGKIHFNSLLELDNWLIANLKNVG